jgi:hypothetical protein
MSESGTILIFNERARQRETEGWDSAHDDQLVQGELVQAAIAYALATPADCCCVGGMAENTEAFAWWPWNITNWKPKDRLSNLVRAGALIAAEIDRLQRLSTVANTGSSGRGT